MTAYCSGATSSARPGFAATVFVAPAAAAALLNNIPTPWAVGFAAILGLLTYELSTFCTTEPPAIPEFTMEDYLALASPVPLPGRFAAASKLSDLVGAYLWPTLCQCDSVPTPAQGPAPEPPPGLIAAPAPVGQANTAPCATYAVTKATDWQAGSNNYRIFPSPIAEISDGSGDAWWDRLLLPSGAATVKVSTEFAAGAGTSLKLISTVYFWQSDLIGPQPLQGGAFDTFPGTTQTRTFAVPAGADRWTLTVGKSISGGGAVTNDATFTAEVFCGSGEGVAPVPCCPPDPMVSGLLAQILDLVTITQRQAAPFAYVYGANHEGLTGNGEFAVSGLLGASVDVTTLPDSYGRDVGTPELLYDLGVVTLGTADGYEVSRRIDHDGSVVLPPLSGVFTTLGYSLAPGVVVSVRELIREP